MTPICVEKTSYSQIYEGKPTERPKQGEFYYNREDTVVSSLQSKCLKLPSSGNPSDIWSEEFIYFDGACLVRISAPYVKAEETYTRRVEVGVMPTKDLPSDLEDLFRIRGFNKQKVVE